MYNSPLSGDLKIIQPGLIDSVSFYILSEHDITKRSSCLVTSPDLQRGNFPVVNGVMSSLKGTTTRRLECLSCKNNKTYCDTHPGHIQLRTPVYNALTNDIILQWLKIICHKCGSLVVDHDVSHIPDAKKVSKYVGITQNSNRRCVGCGAYHPIVTIDKNMPVIFWQAHPSDDFDSMVKKRLYVWDIAKIFERIAPATLVKLAKPLTSHPRRMIYHTIPCIPNGLIPTSMVNRKPSSNHTTIIAISLIHNNNKLPQHIDYDNPSEDDVFTSDRNNLIYRTMIRGTDANATNTPMYKIVSNTNRVMIGVVDRLGKKQGEYRNRIRSTRTDNIFRIVLACSTTAHLREFGIPLRIAEICTYPMTIKENNIMWGMNLLMNARTDTYPMIKRVKRPSTGMYMSAKHFIERNYTLEVGDEVERQLVDGDPVMFNRQPTLKRESINTHFIKVYDQMVGELNSSTCHPYNADFDGDAITAILMCNIKALSEVLILDLIDNIVISSQTAAPMFGFFQDTAIEIAMITRSKTRMTRTQVMQYLRNLPNKMLSKLKLDKDIYTGREALSLIMPPVNFRGTSGDYNAALAPYMPFREDEKNVVIERGQIRSGIIDRKTMGQNVAESFIHKTCRQFGPSVALDLIYNAQRFGNNWSYDNAVTFTFADVCLDPSQKPALQRAKDNTRAAAAKLAKAVELGNFISHIDTTPRQHYDNILMKSILPHGDDYVEPSARSLNIDSPFRRLPDNSDKGKIQNHRQSVCCIGQQTNAGRRALRHNFGFGRTSSHFPRFDHSLVANGYIDSSYSTGIKPDEILASCIEARNAVINIALATSQTGQTSRDLCNAMQSDMTNALRQVVKRNQIVQQLYGDTGINPRALSRVHVPSINPSDAELAKLYRSSASDFKSGGHAKAKLQTALDEEYAVIVKDRNEYRKIMLDMSYRYDQAYNFDAVTHVAVDVASIIIDIEYDFRATNPPDKRTLVDPIWLINTVKDFCADLPYVYTNDIQRARRSRIPEIHRLAVKPVVMLVRVYLSTKNMLRHRFDQPMVELALDIITNTYINALMGFGVCVGLQAAQYWAEPATQSALDTHHTSGAGIGKVDMMTRTSELLLVKVKKDMKNPTMQLFVREQWEDDYASVQNLANLIEMVTFGHFLKPRYHVLFESFGNPMYPDFKSDKDMIDRFVRHSATNRPPSNLINWCVRFEVDVAMMVSKNILLPTMILAINRMYPDVYIVHGVPVDGSVVVRCYFRSTIIRKNRAHDASTIDQLARKLMNVYARGVPGIKVAKAVTAPKTYIADDGSIRSKKIYYIETSGTNMRYILSLSKYFKINQCRTDSIHEILDIWGIMAAYHHLTAEYLMIVNNKIVPHHAQLLASEMCFSGRVLGMVGDANMGKREPGNSLLRICYSAPKMNITQAAYNGVTCPVYGISGAQVLGQTPRVGSNFTKVLVDPEFTKQHTMTNDDLVKTL